MRQRMLATPVSRFAVVYGSKIRIYMEARLFLSCRMICVTTMVIDSKPSAFNPCGYSLQRQLQLRNGDSEN